jgi:hypothetical protein
MSVINVNTQLPGRETLDQGRFLKLAEHFDKFLVDWQMKHPSVFRDRLQMGTLTLFNGFVQSTNVFRGTLGPQAGLAEWDVVSQSKQADGASAAQDACQYNPNTYDWAYDSFAFSGLKTSWRSPVLCVNDLKYGDKMKEQLAFVIQAGSQVTDDVKETFNREQYVKTAVDAGKAMILCDGANGIVDDASVRFSYDPFTVDSDGDTYVTFTASLLTSLSTLNWTYLDFVHSYLSDMAPDAAVSSDSGMPVYGLMIDLRDFERYVLADDDLRNDFRYARPQQLIDGFNMGFKTYRGFALMHDPRQMRFSLSSFTGTTATAKRVKPRKATRAGTIGFVPETNADYINAEIGMGIVFQNEVIQVLVPPVVNNLGSGITFGPAPGYNGSWSWLNIQDADTNPLNEIGYYFARFEYWTKPLRHSINTFVFLYRRCPHVISSDCAIDSADDVAGDAEAVTFPAAPTVNSTLGTVTVTLAKKLAGGVGDEVQMTTTTGNDLHTTSPAYILEDNGAATYVIGYDASDTVGSNPLVAGDFTVDSDTVTLVNP